VVGFAVRSVNREGYVISITPDLALDFGYTYAGGLGVLEGDKFYAAGRLGMRYVVLSLLYRGGYVDYEFDSSGNPIPKPQVQPEDFLRVLKPVDRFTVRLSIGDVVVEALEYSFNTAKAVFFDVVEPDAAKRFTGRLYIEDGVEERFYKYTLLAKASAEFIKRNFELNDIRYIDLQESYTALLPLILRIPGRYRMVIHTAGIWGHPRFPRDLLAREYGYKFVEPEVLLTEIGLAVSSRAFAVSAKHYDVLLKIFPHFSEKLAYVTNGVNLDRWMRREVKEVLKSNGLNLSTIEVLRERVKAELEDLLRNYKKDVSLDGAFVVVWARRVTEYKRPWMVVRLIKELKGNKRLFFVLAGKAHPQDAAGIEYMRKFRELHMEMPNVVYIHDYDVAKAKLILSSGDLLLFTPFSGLEACGTSYMKAAVNGVPTLASRDGGVLELVVDGVNGWLFGEDIRELVELHSEEASRINEREYEEMKARFQEILRIYRENPEKYYSVALLALRSLTPRVSMSRVLGEYYPDVVKPTLL
jgi:starch phosphorylase